MSQGYDRQKISLLRFIECLLPLFENDQRMHHNKIIFNLFDVDRDSQLNIINILYLVKNFDTATLLGQEVF